MARIYLDISQDQIDTIVNMLEDREYQFRLDAAGSYLPGDMSISIDQSRQAEQLFQIRAIIANAWNEQVNQIRIPT